MYINFCVGLICVIHLAIKLCQLSRVGDSTIKKVAKRVIISGILAISSTLIFFILPLAVTGLGILLPIDSAINSFAILISVDLKYKDCCKKYICWPKYT